MLGEKHTDERHVEQQCRCFCFVHLVARITASKEGSKQPTRVRLNQSQAL